MKTTHHNQTNNSIHTLIITHINMFKNIAQSTNKRYLKERNNEQHNKITQQSMNPSINNTNKSINKK